MDEVDALLAAMQGDAKRQPQYSKKARVETSISREIQNGCLKLGGRCDLASSVAVDESEALRALTEWVSNERAIKEWAKRHQLASKLGPRRRGGGGGPVVKLVNALPPLVAEGAAIAVQRLPQRAWEVAEAENDSQGGSNYGAGSTRHRFLGADGDSTLEKLYAALGHLLLHPDSSSCHYTFAAAKYGEGDYIEPHDDAAYKDVADGNGHIVQASRDVAVILYLSKVYPNNLAHSVHAFLNMAFFPHAPYVL
jgi:hypothetical protein